MAYKHEQMDNCPKQGCEGTLVGIGYEWEDSYAWRELECEKCGWRVDEIFEFVRNEDPEGCIVDADGDRINRIGDKI